MCFLSAPQCKPDVLFLTSTKVLKHDLSCSLFFHTKQFFLYISEWGSILTMPPWGTALPTLHTHSLKFPLTPYLWHKTTHKWHHPALTVISPLSLVKCGQGVCHVTAKLKTCQAVRCEVLSKTVHLACWCVYLADVNELVKGITFVSQGGWSCAFQKTLSDWLEFLFDDLNFSLAVWSYFLSCCKFILADSNIFLRGWTCEPYKAH